MPAWLQRDWCSSFVLALGHFLWQGTLIAVVLAIALRATKTVSVRYWLSLAALLVMAVSPVVTLGWLLRPMSHVVTVNLQPIEREEPAPNQPIIPAIPIEESSDVGHVSNVPVIPPAPPLDINATATIPPSVPADDQSWWQKFAPQLTTMYLCGVALMLLRLVFGLWGGRRLRRRVHLVDDPSLLGAMRRQATALGLKLLPVLAYCERVTVPTVVGVLKPMILLPLALTSGLSPEQMESVLAHELAHLRRYDHLVNLLQRVIESLLFFHPAVWWVSHRIRDEREHCCDDLVVACGAMPLDYAKSLLVVAELSRASQLRAGRGSPDPARGSVAAVSLLATGPQKPSHLRQRIARLLGESATPSLRVSPRALLLAIGIPLIALIVTIQSGAGRDRVARPESSKGVADAEDSHALRKASERATQSESPDPALDPTAGLPNSDEETNPPNNANGDPRFNPAAGSDDARRAENGIANTKVLSDEDTRITRELEADTSVRFENVPLLEAMGSLARQHKINIVIDSAAFQELQIKTTTPVTLTMTDVKLSSVLNRILSLVGGERLGYVVKNDVLKLTLRSNPAAGSGYPRRAQAIDPNGEIVGRLVDAATGKPVEGATIACGAIAHESRKKRGVVNAVTDMEGRYRLPVPSPGIYSVWLQTFDKDRTMTAVADDGLLVEAGKVTTSQLLLVKGRKVAGKVVDADGRSAPNREVHCYSAARPHATRNVHTMTTKDDGTFEFVLPAGRADIYVNAPVREPELNVNPFGLERAGHIQLVVPEIKEVAPLTLTLNNPVLKLGDPEWVDRLTPGTQIIRREGNKDVTGSVVDEFGKPLPGANVFAMGGALHPTDDNGEFRIVSTEGKQSILHVFAPGYHVWFGTPTSGDVLKIVMEKKDAATGVSRPQARSTMPDKEFVAKELASFQGTWSWDYSQPWTWPQPIGLGFDGDGRQSEKRWVIEGNRITWVGRDGQRVYVNFTIDPFKTPKQIEFTFLNGPHGGHKSIGIYESKGDDDYRDLCMTDPGTDAPRPTENAAGDFLKQSIIAIHRVAPPAKPSAANELKRLQGVWQMNGCDSMHKSFGGTQQEVSNWQWTIKDDEILWSRQGDVWKLKLKVDPPKSPREKDLTYLAAPFRMELTFLTGPFQGAKCRGIFGWGGADGQRLMIALQDPGSDAPPPTKFAMRGDVKTGLMVLSPRKPSDAERELAAFQGTWTLRNFDTGNFDRNKDPSSWPLPGGKVPDKSGEGSELRWVVKEHEVTWTSRSGEEIKASFTIDPFKAPKQIDLTFLSGPDKGETCPGIYQRGDLDENILWLCIANPASKTDRPKDFSYEWGKSRSVLSFYPFERLEPSNAQSSADSQPKPTPKPSIEPALATPEKPVATELERFQGIWPMNICDTEDRILYATQEVVRHWRWAIKGNEIVWSRSAGEVWHLKFSVDPTKSPKEIDLTYLDGPFKGQTCQGMYEWGGIHKTSLNISIQDPGAKVARPKSISMTGGGQTSLIFLNPIDHEYELSLLQGTWSFKVQSDAWPRPIGKDNEQRWVVKGKEINWTSPKGDEVKAAFTIDPAKSPKQIDVTFLSGPDKGKKCVGIYDQIALTKKALRLCMTDPGSEVARPTEFKYAANAERALIGLDPVTPSVPQTSTEPKSKPSGEPAPVQTKKPAEKEALPEDTSSRELSDTSNNPLVLVGHNDWVTSVAFSPDGKRVASSSRDKTIKVWDAVTGKQSFGVKRTSGDVDVKDGQNNFFQNVAFSSDGQWLAGAGSSDQRIFFWVANTGQVATEFYAGGSVLGLAYNRDGTRLASVGSDVKVWDANLDDHRGGHILSLDAHDPLSMAFSPDGKRVASADRSHTIRVWNAVTGEEQLAIKHTDELNGVVFSPDGKRLASAGSDGFNVWDATSGKKSFQRNGLGGVSSVAFSPDGRRLASSGWDKLVKLWDASTGQELLAFNGHENRVFGLAFSLDGRRLASGSADRTVRLWSVPPLPKVELRSGTKAELRSEPEPSQETRTERKAVAGQKPLVLVGHTGWVTGVTFSPDGKRVASGSRDKTIKVWDTLTGQELLTLKRTARNANDGHTSYVQDVAFSPDGKSLASAGGFDSDGLYLWSAVTGKALCRLSTHTNFVMSVAFSPDGTRLASASSDNTVKIWNANPEQQSGGHLLSIDVESPLSVTFSPDGKRLASAGRDKTIKVWNAVTGERLLTAKHSDQLTCAAFSPDGKRLATAGPTGVNVWDSSTGDMLFELKGLSGVSGVAYSPDGQRLASTGWDQLVKLWDATTGQELLTLKGHGNSVGGLAFSPDGQRLATGSRDWTVRVWDVPSPVVRGALIPAPSPTENLPKAGNDPD